MALRAGAGKLKSLGQGVLLARVSVRDIRLMFCAYLGYSGYSGGSRPANAQGRAACGLV